MHFSNDQLSIDQLPSLHKVSLQPLEPDYLITQKIYVGIATILLMIVFTTILIFAEGAKGNAWFYISAVAVLCLLCFAYIGNIISFKRKGYAIREKDVVYRSGWLVDKTRVIPLNRVQHVSVQSGPIERKFKLGSVSLYTAGSNNADLSIRGLKETTAQQIKQWISSQLNVDNANA